MEATKSRKYNIKKERNKCNHILVFLILYVSLDFSFNFAGEKKKKKMGKRKSMSLKEIIEITE